MFRHRSVIYRESTNISITPTSFGTGVQSTGSSQIEVSLLHVSARECILQGVHKYNYHSYRFQNRSAIYRESTNTSISPTYFGTGVQSTGCRQTQVSLVHISAPECNLQGVHKYKYHSYMFRQRSYYFNNCNFSKHELMRSLMMV